MQTGGESDCAAQRGGPEGESAVAVGDVAELTRYPDGRALASLVAVPCNGVSRNSTLPSLDSTHASYVRTADDNDILQGLHFE
jgi:hypothetical protein